MQKSPIEWTEYSWNPIRGCTEVGPGCEHCYAKRFAERFRGVVGHAYEQGFSFRLAPHKLADPLSIKKPHRIFVDSMSDFFHHHASTEYLRDIAQVMLKADWHIYQVLTKRSKRMMKVLNNDEDTIMRKAAEAPHIWWGVTAAEQEYGLPRIRNLQQTRAHTRWISFEPLLADMGEMDLEGIDWAVAGGESGDGARPIQEAWPWGILKQCRERGIPFNFKQWGGKKKIKNNRLLRGQVYDEYPEYETVEPLPSKERMAAIREIQDYARSKWASHSLAVLEPSGSVKKRKRQDNQLLLFDQEAPVFA